MHQVNAKIKKQTFCCCLLRTDVLENLLEQQNTVEGSNFRVEFVRIIFYSLRLCLHLIILKHPMYYFGAIH